MDADACGDVGLDWVTVRWDYFVWVGMIINVFSRIAGYPKSIAMQMGEEE